MSFEEMREVTTNDLSYYAFGFHMQLNISSECLEIWVDEGNKDVSKEDIEDYYNRVCKVCKAFNYSVKEFPKIEQILEIIHDFWGTAWLYNLKTQVFSVIPLGELDEDCEEEEE